MSQLEGIEVRAEEHIICKLKMSLYSLKQASVNGS